MKYNELQLTAKRGRTRVGRGISAGQGKTAGRGTKGQNARGSGTRPGFEGGQNPLMQRLPKLRGFTSFSSGWDVVYTGALDQLKGGVADNFSLFEAGLIDTPHSRVKLIVKGDVTKKLQIKLQGASANAVAAVQKAGGSFAAVKQIPRPAKKSEAKDAS